uniref:Uncharacterized protein n=1 Tax=Arundo donax TaxID=35708 RepID=A0A0A9AD20_ARUDO
MMSAVHGGSRRRYSKTGTGCPRRIPMAARQDRHRVSAVDPDGGGAGG